MRTKSAARRFGRIAADCKEEKESRARQLIGTVDKMVCGQEVGGERLEGIQYGMGPVFSYLSRARKKACATVPRTTNSPIIMLELARTAAVKSVTYTLSLNIHFPTCGDSGEP